MNNRRVSKSPNDDNQPDLPDLYAKYKDGVREVSVGVESRDSNLRFVYAVTSFAATTASIALAFAGHPTYSVSVIVLLIITGALVAIVRNHAETPKEPADEPPKFGVGSTDS